MAGLGDSFLVGLGEADFLAVGRDEGDLFVGLASDFLAVGRDEGDFLAVGRDEGDLFVGLASDFLATFLPLRFEGYVLQNVFGESADELRGRYGTHFNKRHLTGD